MKKQNYTTIKIPKLSQGSKQIINIFFLSSLALGAIIIFSTLLFPLIGNMINLFLDLYHLYIANLDNLLISFFGGIVYLILLWKVFSVLANLFVNVLEVIFKEATKK
jgi:hypothetical protein